ncbi:hypothetical protein [Nocardia sp. NPDC057455]|uniref:hypothetical protein n=1 Tax=Nocardia sp. NPDC057455 TaxID=3346138 RepID=UPI00367134B3
MSRATDRHGGRGRALLVDGFGVSLRYQFRLLADLMTAPERAPLAVFHARQALLAISWSTAMNG